MVGRRWSVKQAILQSRSLLSTVLGRGSGENFNHLRVVEEERERNAMLEKEGGGEERGRHLRGIAIFFKDFERTGLSPLLLSRPPGGTGVGRILPPLCTSPPTHSSKAISIYERFSSTATRPSWKTSARGSGNFLFSHPLSPTAPCKKLWNCDWLEQETI